MCSRDCKVHFMLRPTPLFAPPGRDFYFRAFTAECRHPAASDIATWATVNFPRLVFHQLDMQPYGLRPNSAILKVAMSPVTLSLRPDVASLLVFIRVHSWFPFVSP